MFDQIPQTVFVAIGTIVAATISSVVALVNIVVSKEQTVSEFRQKWIDSLREEIADFLSDSVSISVQIQLTLSKARKGQADLGVAVEFMQENISRAYTMYHRVLLRLNPVEHKILIEKLRHVESILSKPDRISDSKYLSEKCDEVNVEAHKILKNEWNRVKSGEIFYRTLRLIFTSISIFAVSFSVYLLIEQYT